MRKVILMVAALVLGLSALPISYALTTGFIYNPFGCYIPPGTTCTDQCCLSFTSVTTSDNEGTFEPPKDVAATSAVISTDKKTLLITVDNAYPLYAGTVNFCVKNCGTLPAAITAVNIDNPNPDFVRLTLSGQVAAGQSVPVSGTLCGQLVINGTPQIPEAQDRTFTFTVSINYECVPQTCNTAYAYLYYRCTCCACTPYNARCFTYYGFTNWGWSNGKLGRGTYVFDLYAGAADCDRWRGTKVGTVLVVYANSTATVTYQMLSGYTMSATHLYIGSTPLPVVDGHYTVSPGQYPNRHDGLNYVTTDTYTVTGLSGCIYVVAHAQVCWYD